MPTGIGRRRSGPAFVGRGPVALVGGVRIARSAIARSGRINDEVVAGQHIGCQVRMIGDASVDHRHHDALAGGTVPGRTDVEAGGGRAHRPLLRHARVVGNQQWPHQDVHFHAFDRRVGGKAPHQAFRIHAVQLAVCHQQHRPATEPARGRQAQRLPARLRHGTRDVAPWRRQPSRPAAADAVLVADDEALMGVTGIQSLQIDLASSGMKRA